MKEYLFGIFPCLGALQANKRRIYKMIIKDSLAETQQSQFAKSQRIDYMISLAKDQGLKVEFKAKQYLDKLVGNRPHQNVVMQVSSLSYEKLNINHMKTILRNWEERKSTEKQLWIALDQVQDPMNFGAIIRSAGYFGANGIISASKNSCRLSPTVSKASAGTMEWMTIYGSDDFASSLHNLANNGWEIIGTTIPNEGDEGDVVVTPCNQLALEKPSVIVLGNEGLGIRDEVFSSCTKLTTINSHSKTRSLDSLNVSVATGILIHSLLNGNNRDSS